MDRRGFLKTASFLTISAATYGLAGCDSGDSSVPGNTYVFREGVASGDPRSDSVILWTRVARADGNPERIVVRVQVSLDAGFDNPVTNVAVITEIDFDNTLRHKVTGLASGTTYYYRFISGSDISTVGRTRTAPPPGAAVNVKFAYIACQDYGVNHWAALAALAQEDLDFVVHLGDYIYETVSASIQQLPVEAAHGPLKLPQGAATPNETGAYATTLEDYRYLYRTYRSDPRLQQLHARFPMVAIWDDHEFSGDGWGDHSTYTNANDEQLARRRNATQAWFEYLPVDVPFEPTNPGFENIRIYRDFQFGALVHLVMTDERLYRSDHVVDETLVAPAQGRPLNPAGDDQIGSRYFVDRSTLAGVEAQKLNAGIPVTILGAAQEAWWQSVLAGSPAQWKIWGNEVSLLRMQLDLRTLAPPPLNKVYILNADQWDGYNAARKRLMAFLRDTGIKNVVAITADIHSFIAGQVLDDFDSPSGKAVMVDLVTAGISSTPFFYSVLGPVQSIPSFKPLAPLVYSVDAAGNLVNNFNGTLQTMNPWLKVVDTKAIGYAVVSIQPDRLVAQFKKFRESAVDGSVPTPPTSTITTITVPADTTAFTVTTAG